MVVIDKELAKNKNITILSLLEIENKLTICVDKIKISQVINNSSSECNQVLTSTWENNS